MRKGLLLSIGFVFALATLSLKAALGGGGGWSDVIGGQFVIVDSYSRFGGLQYMIVRNWPESSTPKQRLTDARVESGRGGLLVRTASGRYEAPRGRTRVFFFDGDSLVVFPIRHIPQEELPVPSRRQFDSYHELLDYLLRYRSDSGSWR